MRIQDSGGTIQVMSEYRSWDKPQDIQKAIEYIAIKIEKGYILTGVKTGAHDMEFLLSKI